MQFCQTALNVDNELVLRLEFPERPGALLKLLNKMGNRWNITMFHYRNHGAAYGRVFMGLDVPENEKEEFNQFLEELYYRYYYENGNPAYELFLNYNFDSLSV